MDAGRHLRAIAGWVRPEPLIAVVLWGGIYPGARIGLAEIPPLAFTYLRVVLAACVLALASGGGRSAPVTRRLWAAIGRAGLAQAAFQLLLIAGLARTTAGTSAILLAAAPLMTTGWLALSGKERVPGRHWAGLAVGLAGVALVVHGGTSGFGREQVVGNLIALAAAGAWAAYSLAIAPLAGALGAVRATTWSMIVAGIVLSPFALAGTLRLEWTAISWPAWAGLVYGATAGMVVAMTLWGRSMHALGPTETMVYVYLEPVSAVLIAAALLRERLGPGQTVGAVLTFAGVWLASVVQQRTQRTPPAPTEVSGSSVTERPRG
jgi:drug/metabolite transporter (DMT)-like permease